MWIVSATVTNLQQKLEGLQTANTLMKEDIRIAKSNIVQLQQENLNLRRDKETLLDEHHRQMQVGQEVMNGFCAYVLGTNHFAVGEDLDYFVASLPVGNRAHVKRHVAVYLSKLMKVGI